MQGGQNSHWCIAMELERSDALLAAAELQFHPEHRALVGHEYEPPATDLLISHSVTNQSLGREMPRRNLDLHA
ncbi:hypothetical protein FQZ97_661410 [compost metagenome]